MAAPRFSAGLLLVDDLRRPPRILLLRRSPQMKHHPGVWNLPGGGIEPGETARAAAAREAFEEAGYDRRKNRAQVRWLHDSPLYTTVVATLKGGAKRFTPVLNWESDQWAWATRQQALRRDLHPMLRLFLESVTDDFEPSKQRGRGAYRPRWGSVREVKRVLRVEALARQEADMVLRLFPIADDFYRQTTLVLGLPFTSQAFFRPGKGQIDIGSDVGSADLLAHEVGHLFDSRSHRGSGECVFGTDSWACREAGPIREVTREARALFKKTAAGAMEPRIQARLDTMLPRPFSRRVGRGEDVRIEEVLAKIIPKHKVELAFDFALPFGGFDTGRFAAHTGASVAAASRVADAMRLLPMGVSLGAFGLSEAERRADTRTIRRRVAERQVLGYFMASHEVFARLFDQAVRTRSAQLGRLAGSPTHSLDLPPDSFAQVEPAFWGMAEDLGWTR